MTTHKLQLTAQTRDRFDLQRHFRNLLIAWKYQVGIAKAIHANSEGSESLCLQTQN